MSAAPFEPTDEELQAVSREAFAGVAEDNARALAEMEQRIAAGRIEVMARIAKLYPQR